MLSAPGVVLVEATNHPDRQGIAALLAAHLGTIAPQAKAQARQGGRQVARADLDAVIQETLPALDAAPGRPA